MKAAIIVCLIVLTLSKYDYVNQNEWGGICQTGKQQSPINIEVQKVLPCQNDFTFELTSCNKKYTQTPQSNEDLTTPFTLSNITITRGGKKKIFSALQFHFHEKSEHKINGNLHDLQVHIVHQDPTDKKLAVFGILFRTKAGNFSDPFDQWNLDTNTSIEQFFPIRLATPRLVFHYKGSLTTPECAEGVEWFVDRRVIPIKESNRAKIAELIYKSSKVGNNRNTQPLNHRNVFYTGLLCNYIVQPSFGANPFRIVQIRG